MIVAVHRVTLIARVRPAGYNAPMTTTQARAFLSIRVTPQQKAELIRKADKAGAPNPSVYVIERVFGRSAAEFRKRFHKRIGETNRQLSLLPPKVRRKASS